MYKRWRGSYRYNSDKLQKTVAAEQTNFEVEITSSTPANFVGKITDDLSTGGTPGTGEIIGEISGNLVEFVKRMPVLTVIKNRQVTPLQNKKHRNIFYKGTLSADGRSMSGEWRFKFGFGFLGLLPVIFFPTSGTWTMSAVDY